MIKPAGLSSFNTQQALAPIVPRSAVAARDSADPAKKIKCPWAPPVVYLKQLRTKKTQLFQQIQIEIQALYAEQGATSEEQK